MAFVPLASPAHFVIFLKNNKVQDIQLKLVQDFLTLMSRGSFYGTNFIQNISDDAYDTGRSMVQYSR